MSAGAFADKARTASRPSLRRDASGSAGVAMHPPSYGIDFVDRDAVHAAATRGTRDAGAPLPFLDTIQKHFGTHDVGGVRAHTDATAAEASLSMGARAFTFGKHVAFAGAPDLRVAAHEAAHVVQQRAGVHLKSGMGETDDAYERNADAVADRVVRGESAEALLDPVVANASPSATPAVQRSVGFEIELRTADWHIWHKPKGEGGEKAPPEKGTAIIHGKDFQLQAEYSGVNTSVAELVTNPPGVQNREEFEASVKDMQRLGHELDAVPAKTSDHPASKFAGGDPDFVMDKKENAKIKEASLQVTAGVPIASVYALFKNLEGVVPENERGEYEQARKRAGYVARRAGKNERDEFRGLMVLLQQYLSQLNVGGPKLFVKGLIKVMARTDFHAMFILLPPEDREYIQSNMDTWITHMLSGKRSSKKEGNPMAPGEALVKPIILDSSGSPDPAMRIDTTRRSWLEGLSQKDLLSYSGRETPTSDVKVFPVRAPNQISNEIVKRKGAAPPELMQEYTLALARQGKPDPYGTPGTPEEYYKDNVGAMDKAMQSLYLGLGSLGSKTDFIQYDGEPAEKNAPVDAEHYTAAPILEIRNPKLPQSVDDWFPIAKGVYDAVEKAIASPHGGGESKPKRGFTNVPTPEQLELREKAREQARALEQRLQQLEEHVEK